LSQVSPEELLLVGKVLRPHGLEGKLRILSYAESEKSFLRPGIVVLKPERGEPREFRVFSIKPHKNVLLVKLKGLDSPEEAERYRGADIFLRKSLLTRRGEDEFYWHEIIGLRVCLKSGEHLGTIREIFQTGSNDIYVVREGEKEILIPAISDVVREIDLASKKMIIEPMEGLLEINEV